MSLRCLQFHIKTLTLFREYGVFLHRFCLIFIPAFLSLSKIFLLISSFHLGQYSYVYIIKWWGPTGMHLEAKQLCWGHDIPAMPQVNFWWAVACSQELRAYLMLLQWIFAKCGSSVPGLFHGVKQSLPSWDNWEICLSSAHLTQPKSLLCKYTFTLASITASPISPRISCGL